MKQVLLNFKKTLRFSTALLAFCLILLTVKSQAAVTPQDVYRSFAWQILDTIVDDSMTDYQKCCAVYDYIHAIPYVNVVYSDDWMENGYLMLKNRQGDCFGYYSASRLLLECLGYQVLEMENNNGFTHVWCLVSIDQGLTWLHFDPTVWRWGSDGYLCLVTDYELEAYAQRHYVGRYTVSHSWDKEELSKVLMEQTNNQNGDVYVLYP